MNNFAKFTFSVMEPKGYYIFGGLFEMAETQFLGGKLKVTEEVAQQHKLVSDGMAKLTDMSQRGWHLIEDGCYKREIGRAALIGGVCTAAAIGVTNVVKKIRKKRNEKQEPKGGVIHTVGTKGIPNGVLFYFLFHGFASQTYSFMKGECNYALYG